MSFSITHLRLPFLLAGAVLCFCLPVLAQPVRRTAPAIPGSRPGIQSADNPNSSVATPPPGIVFITQTIDLSAQLSSEETIFSLDGEPVPHFQTIVITLGVIIDHEGHIVTRLANIPSAGSDEPIRVTSGVSNSRPFNSRFVGVDSVTGFAVLKVEDPRFKEISPVEDVRKISPLVMQAPMVGFHPRQSLGRPGVAMLRPRLFKSVATIRKATDDFRYSATNPIYTLNAPGLTAIQDCSLLQNSDGSFFGLLAFDTSGEGHHLIYPNQRLRALVNLIVQDATVARRTVVPHAWLGATGNPAIIAPRQGKAGSEQRGIQIAAVFPDSPADVAGIHPSDVLLSISGRLISTGSDLRETLQMLPADSEVTLTVRRNRELRNLQARLVPAPALDSKQQAKWILSQVEEYERNARTLPEKDPKRDVIERKRDTMVSIANQLFSQAPPEIHLNIRFGLEVLPMTSQLARALSAPGGVLVSKVSSFGKSHSAGLTAGDVIVRVGDQPILDVPTLLKAFNDEQAAVLEIFVVRKGQQLKLTMAR